MLVQLKILQCNINRRLQAAKNTLQLAIELGISIIAVQKPRIRQSRPKIDYRDMQSTNLTASTQLNHNKPNTKKTYMREPSQSFNLL